MPELPEVETVCAGLRPFMEGATVLRVEQKRPNLRFAFPEKFTARLEGVKVRHLRRRAKYILVEMASDEVLVMHLGMSGRFFIESSAAEELGDFHHQVNHHAKHDHVVFHMGGAAPGKSGTAQDQAIITYNDVRRFGFMDLVPLREIETCRHFAGMGPEPLGNGFSPVSLSEGLRGKAVSIKQALLDQRIVAGLGNIYVCEALFRAGISPKRKAGSIAGKRAARLVPHIRDILTEAIAAGGSTLKDHAGVDGELGYFQHTFQVYGREGAPCVACERPIKRLVQSGRSTFYCSACQR